MDHPTQETHFSPRVTRAQSKLRQLNDTREHFRLQQKESRLQRIQISREEPGSTVILEATGFDIDATIFHVEPVATDLRISVENVEQLSIPTVPEEKSSGTEPLDDSEESFFDSVSDQ